MATDEQLETIRTADPKSALEALRKAWDLDYGSVRNQLTAHEDYVVHGERADLFLRFATGGWSENEELIGAFQANRFAWLVTWQLSARGGLFIFKVPQE